MPTYNYGRFIGEAIGSVVSQWRPGVEVVVLDGGSSDDTPGIVRELASRHNWIRYVRQDERGGIDRDMARVIDLATGDCCWLLSADDAFAQGAVDRILDEFEAGSRIVLANRVWCDGDLRPQRIQRWLRNSPPTFEVDWRDDDQVLRFLAQAVSLGALFSFMSCIGFRRDAWQGVPAASGTGASHYAHAERLLRAARAGNRVRYLAEPLILCRGGEDSFRSGGLASRLLIDLKGFDAVARAIFPESGLLADALRHVLLREHPDRRWVRAHAECTDAALALELDRMLAAYGYGSARLRVFRSLGSLLGSVRRFCRAGYGKSRA